MTKDNAVKKFLFDQNNFDKNPQDEPVKPTFSEEALALAKEQSYTQGRNDGIQDTKGNQEDTLARVIQELTQKAEQLIADEDRREIEKSIAVTELTMKVIHKILPQFSEKYSLPEIERVILDSIETRRDEPRIAVTVPTIHLDALKERIDTVALEKGYTGKVILLADDTLSSSDCRVEWADGGAERLYERLFAQIESAFTQSIASMHIAKDTNNNIETTET